MATIRPAIAVAVLLAAAPALAQAPPQGAVVVECKPLSFQARNGAPLVLDWTLHWTGRGILEGALEFDVLDEDSARSTLLGRFRVPDLVVAEIPQSTRLMLPPLDVRGSLSQATIRGKFVTDEFTFTLPDQVAFVPGPDKRSFTIAIPDEGGALPSPGMSDLVQHGLAFERFDPASREAPARAATVPNWIPLEDFPRDPLFLCTFDLVVLVDDGLAQLRQEQLDAVREWVEAGGAVFVRPGELIAPRHVEFLNGLTGLPPSGGFRLDENRKLAWPDDWDTSAIRLHRQSLGRVVIAPQPDGPADIVARSVYDQPEWREVVWFLWRCRDELREPMRDSGTWQGDAPAAEVPPLGGIVDLGALRPNTFGVQPLQTGDWLLNRLIPESVQLVPLWVVGCILALFVVVVGPLDYFVLGMFRLRKLTWAVFPIVALAFAWFTVRLSNSYMQTSEQNRSLVLLDVGDRNQVVRSNELKLYFANTSRANIIEAEGELVAPIDHRRFGGTSLPGAELTFDPDSGMWTDRNGNYYGGEEISRQFDGAFSEEAADPRAMRQQRELVAPPEYHGRPPARYAMSEWLPQWTPHLHRRFRIAPDGEFVEFDWSAIPVADFGSPAGRVRIRRQIEGQFGGAVSIAVLNRDSREVVTDGAGLFSGGRSQPASPAGSGTSDFLFELGAAPARGLARRPADPYGVRTVYGPAGSNSGAFHTGIFSLVSQIAPTGGDNFEDLALLDPTDERQWLLLVAVRHENDWHLYRKLYVGE